MSLPGGVRPGQRELRGAGGIVPVALRAAGIHPDQGRVPGREHVALPHRADRSNAEHRLSSAYDRRGRQRSRPAESLVIRDLATRETRRVPAQALFVFIGAAPRSEWLSGLVDLDDRGFVMCGYDYGREAPHGWPLKRSPYSLETRLPGVFVAGDARRGAVHRIVVAASDGASAAQLVHEYFRRDPRPPRSHRRARRAGRARRSEIRSGLNIETWYRIPDSWRIVSCVSSAFTQCTQETHETHETGSIRVQIRDQTARPALRASPRNR